jgi:hypothetical protein
MQFSVVPISLDKRIFLLNKYAHPPPKQKDTEQQSKQVQQKEIL